MAITSPGIIPPPLATRWYPACTSSRRIACSLVANSCRSAPRGRGRLRAVRRRRANAEARRHADAADVGSPHFDPPRPRLQDPRGHQLHAQPPAPAPGRPRRPARGVHDRGRRGRVVAADQRHDLRLQAPQGREVSRQAPGQRSRDHGRRRALHLRAHPHGQGQRQRLDVPFHRQDRAPRPLHRPLHAEGAVRVVPRHDRQPHVGRHHRQECVETFGDLRKPEAVIGTGPYTLEAYRPTCRSRWCATPHYSCPPCPTSIASRCWWTRTTPRASPRSSAASTISDGSSPA